MKFTNIRNLSLLQLFPFCVLYYARLGSEQLLEKCVDGYTQNANEALHNIVWRFCPKGLFLYNVGVDIVCALAVSCFNDGVSSLSDLVELHQLESTHIGKNFLRKKDRIRIRESMYRGLRPRSYKGHATESARVWMTRMHQKKAICIVPGGFDAGEPTPSKRARMS